MKRENIYTIAFLVLLAAAVTTFFYNREKQDPIPPLLERTGPISTTSEWVNTKMAIEGLQYKLRQNPGDMQSKLFLALAYMQEARVTGEHPYYYPAALKLVNEVLSKKNTDEALRYEATVAKSIIQLSLHQFEEALRTGERALEMNSRRAAVYGVLCDANVELGHYEKAVELADKMVSIRPDLQSYARVSYLREIYGDTPGAIVAMRMAADAGYPGLEQTAWTRVTLGKLHEQNGDLQQAEMEYRQVLYEYPDYAFALGGLARLEAKKKNHQDAIKLFDRAAKVIPEFTFHQELAGLYKLTGQPKKAANSRKELLDGLKEDEEAGHIVDLELANIYLELDGDLDQAMKYAWKEYKRRPNNIDVCKTLATIYYKKRDYRQADKFLKKASHTDRQDASLLCLTGLVSYKLGDRVTGQKLLQRSFTIDPFQNNEVGEEGRKMLAATIAGL
ncbi:tetratricopeptide repeat protein [Pontibacter sp. JH31]|uniref:Tetratricopeptide repeat protein n=1 Tax=Pontibacter aquaedesilientis TaxID=2766980 RepID=A0ABR7XEU9_9BACT|nr:tetratricopeptide repeat protein [Pontibacter aquaedesilientis]MBD1396436.1 tetratricopeptide repeat protein [Pontibacter aquaedesilientis]